MHYAADITEDANFFGMQVRSKKQLLDAADVISGNHVINEN
jgi:hypothetical protein